jgi:hypothetical protein
MVLEGARNTKFRQVRASESVIPYILCGLNCLRWWPGDLLSGEVPVHPYIVRGDRVTWKFYSDMSPGVLHEYFSGSFLPSPTSFTTV